MKASKLLILWMFLATSIWAQETANYVANWHFGQQSAIDFTSGSPVNVSSQIIGNEAMTSVSDGNGSLLFYSSADSTIWDASDQIMPNSYGLTSDQSASCGMVACRVPGTCDQYYIFYINTSPSGRTLSYSVIDMSLPGNGTAANPLGDVVPSQKNILHFNADNIAEKLLIIQKGNTENYWLMARSIVNDVYYAFEVGASGIDLNPVVSTLPGGAFPGIIGSPSLGWVAVNRQRNIIAEANGIIPDVRVFDFDNTTGIVSNPEIILTGLVYPSDLTYGLAFSPSGDKLHVGWSALLFSNYMSSFDVSGGVGTVGGTRVDHDISSQFLQNGMCRAMALGPDGRIYIAWDGIANNNYLGVINTPEDINNPNIVMQGHMITNTANLGLPNIAYYYHPANFVDSLAAFDRTICINESTRIGLMDYDSIWGTYVWEPAAMVMDVDGASTQTVSLAADQEFVVSVYEPCGDFIKSDTVLVRVDPCLLSIDLTDFQASLEGQDLVNLRWWVDAEHEMSHYIIERSADGYYFESYLFLDAQNVAGSIGYQIDDVEALKGMSYYRLVAVGKDGEEQRSVIRNIYNKDDIDWSVFPNPTSGDLTIRGLQSDKNITVHVINSLGQSVRNWYHLNASHSVQVSLSGLPNGAYFVSIQQDERMHRYVTVIKK